MGSDFLFLVPVNFSEYKETELLLVVRMTRYLGFRVRIPTWDGESFPGLWKKGEEGVGTEQNLLCFGGAGGH